MTPSKLSDDAIIYCTRYEEEIPQLTGIFKYNIKEDSNKLIKSWQSMKYYPRWNSMIYSKRQNTLYSVGGANVKLHHAEYMIIMEFNLITMAAKEIPIKIKIGANPQLLFTNNDNLLHIFGGQCSAKHIIFNLTTNKYRVVHDFSDTNPTIQQQGALYNQGKQEMYMFGGLDFDEEEDDEFDDFWIAKTSDYIWDREDKFKLPLPLHSFGAVLYDGRIIIIFGGDEEKKVYFLDLNDDEGWKESKFELPIGSAHHAVMMTNDTVHILPFYDDKHHYIVEVDAILPASLMRKRMIDEEKESKQQEAKIKEDEINNDLGGLLKSLQSELDSFKMKYDEQKLQEIMKQSPKELIQKDSTINTKIAGYRERIDGILLTAKSFSKHIDDTESTIKRLATPNVQQYRDWNLDQIMAWIMGLENGEFIGYEDKLRNGFIKSKIKKGDVLTELDRSDLSSSPFNIDEFMIKKKLINHFQSLKNGPANVDNKELNEGTVTEYH